MPTNYFEKLKPSLEEYNKNKGIFKQLFDNNQAAINKLLSLSPNDHDNLFKICQCFFKNTPKPLQASYEVYDKLSQLNELASLFLRKFEKEMPSPEHKLILNLK